MDVWLLQCLIQEYRKGETKTKGRANGKVCIRHRARAARRFSGHKNRVASYIALLFCLLPFLPFLPT
jgi:hypothetical protein